MRSVVVAESVVDQAWSIVNGAISSLVDCLMATYPAVGLSQLQASERSTVQGFHW